MKISIVIPAYNEADSLAELCSRIEDAFTGLGFWHEVIIADDGSTDGSPCVIKKLQDRFPGTIRTVRFDTNQGKTAALIAGFREARGDIVITMDGDLQNDPADIPLFVAKMQEGYDLVCGWRADRKDPVKKIIMSNIFNGILRAACGTALHDINCGFKSFSKKAADGLLSSRGEHRFIPILAERRNCRVTEIRIGHHPRKHGESRYSTLRPKAFKDLLRIVFFSR